MKPYYLAAAFVALAAITVLLGAILILNSGKSQINKTYVPTQTVTTVKPTTSPVPVPLTEPDADKTFTSIDIDIQATLNQTDQDLGEINTIDQSQDSVAL